MEDFNYSVSEMPCNKHPNISSVGICPHCLKDRLLNLVCSDCGEQRLSSCSCSDVSSSYRNSCSTMEIGSVGRISFLLENEKLENQQLINQPNCTSTKSKNDDEHVIYLKRSNSSCVEVKKSSNGFWKIKRLFRKKRSGKNGDVSDEKSEEVWVSDIMGVSRSRSLCSFSRNGNDDFASSSAKISDVTSGIFFNNNETEPRKSGFKNSSKRSSVDRNVINSKRSSVDRSYSVGRKNVFFPSRESDFSGMDESGFIDLKLDSESRQELFVNGRRSDVGIGYKSETYENLASCLSSNTNTNGGDCCRINNVNENKGLRRSKSHKVWKWIFGNNSLVSKEKITS